MMENSKRSVEIDEDLIEAARKRSKRRRELLKQGITDEIIKDGASIGSHLSAHVDIETNTSVKRKVVRKLKKDRT